MSVVLRILVAAALLPLAWAHAVRAEDLGAAYVVSYVEVLPDASDHARELLKAAAAIGGTEDGNVRFEVLQQIGAPHHFAVLEVWKDAKAQQTHATAARTNLLRQGLGALQASPYDERVHVALAVGAAKAAGAIYTVTHVDCVGSRKDDGAAQLKEVSAPSREETGNLRFDVVQQANRPNHFTIIGAWRNDTSLAAHVAAAYTMRFRAALHPMTGSPYDERVYRAVE